MNPYKDIEDSTFTVSPNLAYEDIATKLLKDNLFLTALELHTELVENGKELPQLREFFSNPGNFEQHVLRAADYTSMHRTPSQATLDSIDTARYSEDGGGDRGGSGSDIAVLEFELRKARETINALRANLTQFADGESNTDKSVKDNYDHRSLKPHEKRALNFLINEYLLVQNYKLTSITFSDENPDQEFEDWDDVGLNMPRPASLISLFWGSKSGVNIPKTDAITQTDSQHDNTETECQTDIDEGNVCVSCRTSLDHDTEWNHELLVQAEELDLLKLKIIALETEKKNFQKLYDAAIVSLNSLTSPSESKPLNLQIPSDKLLDVQSKQEQLDDIPITCTASENHYGSGNSTHSATPEQFEMIYSDKNNGLTKKEGSIQSFEPALIDSLRESPYRHGSVTTLDESLSINDVGEWTRIQYESNSIENNKEMWIDSRLPSSLKESLLSWCYETQDPKELITNDLLLDLVNSKKLITLSGLLPLVADTLPRVLPHTLVSRRAEATALTAAAAVLLPAGDARRSRLLQLLLTLYKKPEPSEAKAVCEATSLIVKWGGSGEVLSSVAELLSSRTSERRVLASQVCLSIAPYVPMELCTSLLLSLIQVMCESSEPDIRNNALKVACLICPVGEHKYAQLENIMFNFLKDPIERNVKDTICVLVPVLARSALAAGKFSTDFHSRVMNNIISASSNDEWKTVILYLDVIQALVLAQLAYVINVQIVKDINLNNCDMETINLQEVSSKAFLDLQCYMADNVNAKVVLAAVNCILRDSPDIRWNELDWFVNVVRQILEVATKSKALNHHAIYELLITLFNSYLENFGPKFACEILNPVFVEIIMDLENKIEKLHAINVDSVVTVGIYLPTLLVAVEGSRRQGEFLQKWVVYSSIRGLPTKILSIPFKWLTKSRPDVLNFYLEHLREFCASSFGSSNGTAIRVFVADLFADLVHITDVDEDCLEKQLLPTAAFLMVDDDVSVREAALGLWGGVCASCVRRALALRARCWAPLERAAAQAPAPREAARAAHALAALLPPAAADAADAPDAHTLQKVASLMCALAPALQDAPRLPALLPALRKLEEAVHTPSLSQYRAGVEALAGAARAAAGGGARAGVGAAAGGGTKTAAGVGEARPAHDGARRVATLFTHTRPNISIPNIFKKKT